MEARSIQEVLSAGAEGFPPEAVYCTALDASPEALRSITGLCRMIAGTPEELRRINEAASAAAPSPVPVGLRLVLDGEAEDGFAPSVLPALSRELRTLASVSVQGCFVRGETAGLHGEALGRYFRRCFETAKQMSATLPCSVRFLCIEGGGEAADRAAGEHPETLTAFRRTAEIVAAQNQSAFYARLLVT